MKRLRVYLEPRDAWMGAYIAEKAVYVCPLPFLVIRWERHPKPVTAALAPIDPYDDDSLSATEREIVMTRLGELEGQVATLSEMHEPTAHCSPHSAPRHPGQMLLDQS